jgi:hypothetical protein
MTAVVPVMATVAAIARRITAVATTAAVTAEGGRRRVVTAHQGDTNQREENRNTKNHNSVHPRILQICLQVPVI